MSGVSWKAFLPLAVAAVLATSACSTLADPPALTVNGTEISAASVDGELRDIQDNEDYRTIVENDCQGVSSGQGQGTFDSACVARLLSLRVYYEIIEQKLDEEGMQLGDDDLLAAREQLEVDLTPPNGGDSALDGFDEELQDTLVRRYALVDALRRLVGEEAAFSGEAAQQYYDENSANFEQACVSHILASTDGATPEEAKARIDGIAARIAAGEDFTALATTENQDTAAAAAGGDLQCGGRGRFVKEFDDEVFRLPAGQVSQPVQTEFGWHLILVRERSVPSFAEVQPQIQQDLQQEAAANIGNYLSKATCEATVDVDPRFGSWDDEGCGAEGGDVARVVPPEGPVTPSTTALDPLATP